MDLRLFQCMGQGFWPAQCFSMPSKPRLACRQLVCAGSSRAKTIQSSTRVGQCGRGPGKTKACAGLSAQGASIPHQHRSSFAFGSVQWLRYPNASRRTTRRRRDRHPYKRAQTRCRYATTAAVTDIQTDRNAGSSSDREARACRAKRTRPSARRAATDCHRRAIGAEAATCSRQSRASSLCSAPCHE